MKIRPKTYLTGIGANLEGEYGDVPKVIFGEPGYGCWIQCEVFDPPSSAGRSVDVYIPPELVAPLMKELRTVAIRARQQPM